MNRLIDEIEREAGSSERLIEIGERLRRELAAARRTLRRELMIARRHPVTSPAS